MKNKFLVPVTVLTIVCGLFLGASHIQAVTTTQENKFTSFIHELAQKFNINETELKNFFEDKRSAHMTRMHDNLDTKLDKLVSNGKITAAQKKLILDKLTELKNNQKNRAENFNNMTEEQRKAARDAERKDLQDWANKNGIDLQYLMFGRLGKVGMGGMWHMK